MLKGHSATFAHEDRFSHNATKYHIISPVLFFLKFRRKGEQEQLEPCEQLCGDLLARFNGHTLTATLTFNVSNVK